MKVKIASHRDLDLEYISDAASFPEVYSVLVLGFGVENKKFRHYESQTQERI